MDINEKALSVNRENYADKYSKQEAFLRYPADWIARFHNIYLKNVLPTGRILDYGCGSGNNSMFFIEKGYEVYGVDVTETILPLVKANLKHMNLDQSLAGKFSVISPDCVKLPFEDGFFDFVLCNQVFYYLPSEEHIKKVCKEMSRCLKPGGTVFFTTMGPKNYYITTHTKQIHQGKIHEIRIGDPNHRLKDFREFIYLVKDKKELKELFSEFECVSTGYYDQSMFDMSSTFHWIFVGKKKGSLRK